MKKTWIVCLILCGCLLAFAEGSGLNDPTKNKAPKVEIAELEAMIAQAKATGQTPDPAWTTRIRELVPLVKGHPGDVVYELPSFDANGGFAPGAVIRPQELTPLEQQIKQLEFEIDGGFGGQEPDAVTVANLKDQLNTLFAQRPADRYRDPLDQGNDNCPGTVVPSVAYTDSGTTVGRANNFNPITPCASTNAPDVIYSFTPPTSTFYTITTAGSTYDTYLYINFNGACPGTNQLSCDDDGGPGLTSQITVRLYSFETYYIIVDGYSANSGFYILNIFENCQLDCQAGDVIECAEAIVPTHSINDCNGACNNQSGNPTWQDIFPCQTICGRGFTYINHEGGNYRDTDSYRFTLTEACTLRITLNSEFTTQLFIFDDSCPFSTALFNQSWIYPCSSATFMTGCLEAGDYGLWVGPTVFSGYDELREYRVRMDILPCNGCRIDASITAPGTHAWNTCFAGNDCVMRPSTDYTYCINIPYESDWTFSTCNDDSIWDSFMYLMFNCCDATISADDDGCGGVGLSVINCVHLQRGTYYLTVEGFSSTSCGPFVLNVTECLGSCCYGGPENPICSFINPTDCDSLSGLWTNQEPCSTGACYVRPQCDADAQFGQEPYLPDEAWNGFPSDQDDGFIQVDNYVVSNPIGSIRFWGFPVFCSGVPEDFQIIFEGADSVGYNVTLTGTQLAPLYNGTYNLAEYYATLSPPCNVLSGNLNIAQYDNPGCTWYWSTTPFGDGVLPGDFAEFAFCLGTACVVDSATLIWDSPGNAMHRWWQSDAGAVTLWYTTDPNAVYPAGFLPAGLGAYPAGNNSIAINANFADYVGLIVVVDCTPAAIAAAPSPSPILIIREESK